jgi:hypothetical protein
VPDPRCVPMSEGVEIGLSIFAGIGVFVALLLALVVWELLIKPAFQDWRRDRRAR